jgi:alpha-N-arabinofuranosidase
MANYAQTVNVIGAIKTTATAAELEPTGLVLALYRRHFGTLPVAARGEPGSALDVAAAWTADRTALTIGVVNPDPGAAQLRLELVGARPSGRVRRFVLSGSGPWSHNAPGRPRGVTVEETSPGGPPELLRVPPLSVSLFILEADDLRPPGR